MRVTFICGSLEEGRDGVGDYTRRLAGRIAHDGHVAQLVALHDRHVGRTSEGAPLRLAASTPWAERARILAAHLDAFAPDWISLQFVAYAFHDRGLVFGLGPWLREAARSTPVHLMFHELWTRGLQGRFQEALIRRMVGALEPAVVHAQASPYVALLERNGIPAARLPLFGNIPFDDSSDDGWLRKRFEAAGVPIASEGRNRFWLFGLFGTIHPEWQPEAVLPRIHAVAAARGKRPVLVAIGRLGERGLRVWSQIGRMHSDIPCVTMGEQPHGRISQVLQVLDFGITSSPLALVGKSGTVAAMRDHGVPVVVSRNDVSFPFEYDPIETRDPLIVPVGPGFDARLATAPRQAPHESLDDVARQWLASLAAHDPCAS